MTELQVMTELKAFESMLDIAVNLTILLGTGAAVTWWMTRRIENRIAREVKHMDRLQSIEKRMDSMATKDDVAEMLSAKMVGMATKEDMVGMATKDDVAEMLSAKMVGMATKEDMVGMATKEDMVGMATKMVTEMATQMVTKEDIAARMDALKTDLLEAIKNANGNGHR